MLLRQEADYRKSISTCIFGVITPVDYVAVSKIVKFRSFLNFVTLQYTFERNGRIHEELGEDGGMATFSALVHIERNETAVAVSLKF